MSKYPHNWNRLRRYIFERDNYTCAICGRKTKYPECHHIIPISSGGDNNPNNLITLCKRCHRRNTKYVIR